ncbi:MAG: hypothetical protein K0R00_3196 [Herbinix sp.]|nr:hypothetical protein [Herbinix sp.]
MNKVEFIVLSILYQNEAVSRLKGLSVKDILTIEKLNLKENTLYKQLKTFQQQGFVGTGAKEGKALTFYITKAGIKKLEEEQANEG